MMWQTIRWKRKHCDRIGRIQKSSVTTNSAQNVLWMYASMMTYVHGHQERFCARRYIDYVTSKTIYFHPQISYL